MLWWKCPSRRLYAVRNWTPQDSHNNGDSDSDNDAFDHSTFSRDQYRGVNCLRSKRPRGGSSASFHQGSLSSDEYDHLPRVWDEETSEQGLPSDGSKWNLHALFSRNAIFELLLQYTVNVSSDGTERASLVQATEPDNDANGEGTTRETAAAADGGHQ